MQAGRGRVVQSSRNAKAETFAKVRGDGRNEVLCEVERRAASAAANRVEAVLACEGSHWEVAGGVEAAVAAAPDLRLDRVRRRQGWAMREQEEAIAGASVALDGVAPGTQR